LVILVVIPLLKYFKVIGKTDYNLVARQVGEKFPEVKDELLNALQLNSIQDKQLYSTNLIGAAFIRIYEKVKNISFESAISFDKAKKLFYYAAGISALIAMLLFSIPGLKAASGRLLNFNQDFIPPQKFYFEVTPGNAQVTKGQDVSIKVRVKGEKPNEVFLAVKDIDQTNFNLEKLSVDSLGNYNFERRSIRHTFSYYATAHHLDDQIETFFINLLRGTGISGLHGILPKQGNLIHPMLFTYRDEIEKFAQIHKIKYREDSSNTRNDYTRNKIRHLLLPVIKKIFL